MRFRGEYNPETWYKKMDVVTNGNHAYLVQIDNRCHRLDDTQYFMALMQGRPGDPGKDGKSAYDLAVEYQGFNGTVLQWLASLRGEQGIQGTPGQLNGLVTDLNVASYPDADTITSKNIYALDGTQKNLPRSVSLSPLCWDWLITRVIRSPNYGLIRSTLICISGPSLAINGVIGGGSRYGIS